MSIARSVAAVLAVASAASWSSVSSAAEPGWYYGLNAGQSSIGLTKSELDAESNDLIATAGPPLSSTSTFEDNDTSWSIFFGYQFSPNFAFEAGYLNLGSYPYRYAGTANLTGFGGTSNDATTVGYTRDVKGYPISILGILPLGPVFDVHARAGLLFTSAKQKVTSTAGSASLAFEDSATSQDLFFGAGAAMNLGETWTLSVDWAKYDGVGDDSTIPEADHDVLSLSVIYRFGPL
jgi:OOP family OmpA-OmpF porin